MLHGLFKVELCLLSVPPSCEINAEIVMSIAQSVDSTVRHAKIIEDLVLDRPQNRQLPVKRNGLFMVLKGLIGICQECGFLR